MSLHLNTMVRLLKVYKWHVRSKNPLQYQCSKAFHSHPGGCWGAFHSSRSVLYKRPRMTEQVTRELLAMRADENSGTGFTFLTLFIMKGNQRRARFKMNPL